MSWEVGEPPVSQLMSPMMPPLRTHHQALHRAPEYSPTSLSSLSPSGDTDFALTRPTLCSEIVQESMKVCAMTARMASTLPGTRTSKMSCGFFKVFTQNRSSRLETQVGYRDEA